MLGKDTATEWRMTEALGGSPNRFFQLAQRIAWGITQPDLVRVDVIATAAQLVRSHGEAFPAHLFDAWVWRVREPARAERALDRARALSSTAELRCLLPSDDEWLARAPAQQLVEVVPDEVWRVTRYLALAGAPFHLPTTATVLRTRDGLVICNPVAFDPEIADAIDRLGPVRWICSQGKAHGAFVGAAKQRFPAAITLGTRGHLAHPSAARLVFDDLLERAEIPDLERIAIDGSLLEEIALVHRPSRTLVIQDLVMQPALRADWPFLGRLYSLAFGIVEHLGFPSYALMTWLDMGKLHRSLRTLHDSTFDAVAVAHGPSALEDGPTIRATLDDVLAIGRVEHKLLLARYAAAEPAFLRDALKYLSSTKNARGARLTGA